MLNAATIVGAGFAVTLGYGIVSRIAFKINEAVCI
jgi:hypothetical protein